MFCIVSMLVCGGACVGMRVCMNMLRTVSMGKMPYKYFSYHYLLLYRIELNLIFHMTASLYKQCLTCMIELRQRAS